MRNNKRKQSGKGIVENLAKLGFEMGSRAINSFLGKRLINKGVNSIASIFKYGVSKIKNKNIKRALNSEVEGMVLQESQKKSAINLILYFLRKVGGISNFQIENAIKNIGDDGLIDNFVGVFPSNYIDKFSDHASMISDKGKYPFVIANTDSSEKPGVHWWRILDIDPKTDIFFFDSFGLDGLNYFTVQDDKPVVEKILLGVEKMTRTDNKITLCKIRFNLGACKNLSEEEIECLSKTFTLYRLLESSSNSEIL